MEKKEIIKQIREYIDSHKLPSATHDALEQACKLMEASQKKESWMKALDIIIKLLGIGSNFFK
jgi:hypothetical protein